MTNEYYLYKTIQGDTFDAIALDFYNEEKLSSRIIEANPKFRNVLIFNAGVQLVIPVLKSTAAETLPPWKR